MNSAQTRRTFLPYGYDNLHRQRGENWAALVADVDSLPMGHERVIAFRLMLDRARREMGMAPDTCRDRLCAHCTAEVVAVLGADDRELMARFHRALDEVHGEMRRMQAKGAERRQAARAA